MKVPLCVLVVLGVGLAGVVAAAEHETPTAAAASALLPAGSLQSEHWQVREEVRTDGFMNIYNISSDYGELEAFGDAMLAVRITELRALDTLSDLSKADIFADSALQSALRPVQAVSDFAERPVETLKSVPDGVGRMFKRAKRQSKQLKAAYDDKKAERGEEGGAGSQRSAL